MQVISSLAILSIVALTVILLSGLALRVAAGVAVMGILNHLPRAQQRSFVIRLRELVFGDPYAFMTSLCGENGRSFVRQLWVEVGWKVARARLSTAPADEAMDVETFRLGDGRTIAVVCLPPPQNPHETFFVGIVLPMHPSLRDDIKAARTLVRFFILNRYGGSRKTDLCGWTINREERTYNVGAPQNPRGFAQAVEAKLLELRQ